MKLKNYNVYFFFAVLAVVTILAIFILRSFIVPFIIAAILAHLFNFIYKYFLRKTGRKGFSSALTCLIVGLMIILPAVLVVSLAVGEIQGAVSSLSGSPGKLEKITNDFIGNISGSGLLVGFDIKENIGQGEMLNILKGLSQNALNILQGAYQGVANFIFVSFVVFFSLFYLFIDGEKLVKKIMSLSPLRDEYEKKLIDRFNSTVRATVKGTSLIAILQGLLGAALFSLTGVSSPVLLGTLMVFSSVIPSVGSGLVWVPVGLVMLFLGHIVQGLTILIFGGLVISTIDNFIRPRLVQGDTQIHPLLIFFSTFGGLATFGFIGFIIGPVIISFFVVLWEIYSLEFKRQLDEYNG